MADLFSGSAKWITIEICAEIVRARLNALMVPVNPRDILIMGGYGEGRISDICVFNTVTMKAKRVKDEIKKREAPDETFWLSCFHS